MSDTSSISVRTLLGVRGFETSITCLTSLLSRSADPIRLIVHEDGSLKDEHRERLLALAPRVELVNRSQADEVVIPLLERLPRCRATRASGPLFLKLFDVALMATGSLEYCDSDVLFLRPFSGIFGRSASAYAFMTDVSQAYSIRPWRVWPTGSIRLGGRVNTGLISGPANLDLEYVEWVLEKIVSDVAFARRPYWAEQTCWAAIASRCGFRLFDPRRVILASADMKGYNSETVAIHFVSTFRDRLKQFESLPESGHRAAVEVSTVPGRRVTAAGLLWTDFRRRLDRRATMNPT